MDSLNQKEWLESTLLTSLKKNSRQIKIEKIETSPAIGVGLNHCSRLLRLDVDYELDEGKKFQRSFIMKQMPDNENDKACVEELELFPTEIKIFDMILRKMETLLSEARGWSDNNIFWPKMYGTNGKTCLLLEDLKVGGFTTVTGRECTLEEGLLTMKALGRFHGMSVILKERGLIDVSPYPDFKIGTAESCVDFVFISSLKGIIGSARNSWPDHWKATIDKIESVIPKIKPGLKKLVNSTRGKFDVLNHGDFWANNIMYKTTDGVASDLRIIDFQLCHYNWFAWDLVHFIYCAYVPSSRDKYRPTLLSTYLDSLRDTLNTLGSTREPLSQAQVTNAVDSLLLMGMLFSLSTVPRLMPVVELSANALTDYDSAQAKKADMYSIPEVVEEVTSDLKTLASLDICI